MTATAPVVTLSSFVKLDFPGGAVRLCDGGMIEFDGERYEGVHAVFGAIHEPDAPDSGFGDAAEDGRLVLAPNPEADIADWWRGDLADCRVQAWLGEVDGDGFTVSEASMIADLLVDTVERIQDAGGQDLLALELVGRAEKLFLRNEGNVLSDTFHQRVYPGETGFANCTDLVGFVAWGAESPARSAGGGGAPGGGDGTKYNLPDYLR